MPPLLIGAGIAAAGTIGGSLIASSGAKKAAKTQADAADRQIAANNANRDYQYGLNAPTIDMGNRAGDLFSGFVGAGGDPAASGQALDAFRGSTGYQDLLKEGLGAVNANAYAGGMGNSGATLKALQDRGMSIADRSSSGWLNNLNQLMNFGGQARGLVANVGTQTVGANNAATQNAADASSNASLVNSSNWASTLKNLGLTASNAYGSSYGGNSRLNAGSPFDPSNGATMTGTAGGTFDGNGRRVPQFGFRNIS